MMHCWNEDSLDRPSFTHLRETLQEKQTRDDIHELVSLDINFDKAYYHVRVKETTNDSRQQSSGQVSKEDKTTDWSKNNTIGTVCNVRVYGIELHNIMNRLLLFSTPMPESFGSSVGKSVRLYKTTPRFESQLGRRFFSLPSRALQLRFAQKQRISHDFSNINELIIDSVANIVHVHYMQNLSVQFYAL